MSRLNNSITNTTGRFGKKLALALAAVVAGAAPASAFSIDFTYQPGMTEEQIAAVEMAGLYWESLLTDDINVQMHVGAASNLQLEDLPIPADNLGLAIPGFTDKINYQPFKNDLKRNITSEDDQTALNNLSGKNNFYKMMIDGKVSTSKDLRMTYANAMATQNNSKYKNKTLHGAIIFNDDQNWFYGHDVNEIGDDQPDLVSTIAHEIGHNLGFVSGVGLQGEDVPEVFRTPLDMFRYSDASKEQGAIEFTRGAESFFSIDGEPIANFATGALGEDGASHWKEGENGLMEGHNLFGTRLTAETIDLRAFDVIGYDLSGNTEVDWAELKAQAEAKLDDIVIEDRLGDVEAMLEESGFSAARPSACPPFCSQELAQTAEEPVAEAVPEPGVTMGLLGLGFVGAVGSQLKRGTKNGK